MTSKTKWLLFLIAVVAVSNVVVYLKILDKREELQTAKHLLLDDEPIDQHLKGLSQDEQQTYYQLVYSYPAIFPQLKETVSTLTNALHALDSVVDYDTIDSKAFFSERIAVAADLQERLWVSNNLLVEQLQKYAVQDGASTKSMDQTIHEKKLEYLNMIQYMEQAPNGTRKTFHYALVMGDTSLNTKIRASKKENIVEWEERIGVIPSYLDLLYYFRANSKKENLQICLEKFKNALPEKGKVKVYSSTYDLNNISPAELQSTYKYLSFLHGEIASAASFKYDFYRR